MRADESRSGDRWALACAIEIAVRAALDLPLVADGEVMVLRRMQIARERGELQPRSLLEVWAALDVVVRGDM